MMKNFVNSEKNCNFAVSSPKTILRACVCVAIFVATNTAVYTASNRLSFSNGCYAEKPAIVFGETERDSLFLYYCKHFSFMPKTMKNASRRNNSSLVSTPNRAKSEIQEFIELLNEQDFGEGGKGNFFTNFLNIFAKPTVVENTQSIGNSSSNNSISYAYKSVVIKGNENVVTVNNYYYCCQKCCSNY